MKPFVYVASLVLAGLLGFGLCSLLDKSQYGEIISTLRDQAEEATLLAKRAVDYATKSEAKMDSLKAHTDSVEAHRVHDTIYIPSVWRRVKLYDINVKMDSLKSL